MVMTNETQHKFAVPRTQVIHDIALEVAKITLVNDGTHGLKPEEVAVKLWKTYNKVLPTIVTCADGATQLLEGL